MKIGKSGSQAGQLVCTFLPRFCDARCPAGTKAVFPGQEHRIAREDCVTITPADYTGYSCVICKPKACDRTSADCGPGETFDPKRCACVKKAPNPPSTPGAGSAGANPDNCVGNCSGISTSYISHCPTTRMDQQGIGFCESGLTAMATLFM